MVKVRLTRIGKKHRPAYRLIAIDSRKRATGKPLEFLGNYDPINSVLNIKTELVDKWVKSGAQVSKRVIKLLEKYKANE